jgi:putative peptidoglycan lipid II flippase
MGVAAAVSRGFGAIRVLVIAAVLGTTYLGNAFQSANTVSNVLFELLAAGALSAVLVPSFVRHLEADDRRGAEQLAGELLGLAVLLLGAVSLVGVVLAPWIATTLTAAVEDPQVASRQQQLITVLLWFFIPQVVLYAYGAISTAVLHAQRSFVVPALAPIGNTVVLVGFLVAFSSAAGPDPGLSLTGGEQVLLGLGGTLGVLAFVAAPGIAVWRSGFRLVPRFSRSHEGLRRLVSLSGWATVQHAFAALLLGGAIIAGGAVEGGVVAYQVGWFFFLAPYGIIAQPIHTTILPELVAEHASGDTAAFAASLRWGLDSMAVLLVPLSALCLALSAPAMSVLAFGQASSAEGVDLLAAALASLGVGLLPYGAFFLLARAWYVLGDSRTPALIGGAGALVGVAIMGVAAVVTSSRTTVVALGAAHTVAFLIASVALVVALHRRTGQWVLPSVLLRSVVVAAAVGAATWGLYELWSPSGRGTDLLALVVLAPAALLAFVMLIRLLGVSVTQRLPRGGAPA